jgi:hypothetical protein
MALQLVPIPRRDGCASDRAAASTSRGTGRLRYRPEHGDLLVKAGFGWQPGVVGKARLGIDAASPSGHAL